MVSVDLLAQINHISVPLRWQVITKFELLAAFFLPSENAYRWNSTAGDGSGGQVSFSCHLQVYCHSKSNSPHLFVSDYQSTGTYPDSLSFKPKD